MRPDESASRFAFGENWTRFLAVVNEERICRAAQSLKDWLGEAGLESRSFLDAGSGSGLFSLAARRLGARVHSFDADPQSVRCTETLRERYFPGDERWTVEQGSIVDPEYTAALGRYDIVYSWGVLHHTGRMWEALEATTGLVKPGGTLFIAIYNDQGRASRRWKRIKECYTATPPPLRWAVVAPAFLRLWGPTFLRDAVRGRPLESWRSYSEHGRGMSPWLDVIDWVGGFPFEVAKPEEVFEFCHGRGFDLKRLRTCGGGPGCNEFVFQLKEIDEHT